MEEWNDGRKYWKQLHYSLKQINSTELTTIGL